MSQVRTNPSSSGGGSLASGGVLSAGFEGSDRFELVRELGAGGMGAVYEAIDRERGGRVALKTMLRVDAQAIYRLKREFRAVAEIDHPNLVRLGELFHDRGAWFFTMELVDGVSLASYVGQAADAVGEARRDDRVPFHEARLRASLIQLARAVSAVHAAGMVHRDVKPSNIMVEATGRLVLMDFGLVAPVDGASLGSIGSGFIGTPDYMAPEQAAASRVGPAADWYSVGAVLYELLTGRAPHGGSALEVMMAKQKYEPPPPRGLVPTVPADLDQLCADLLRRDPAARPRGDEVLARLGAADAGPRPMALGSTDGGSRFVGRARELAALEQARVDSRRSRPVVCLVCGESGIGKSALVEAFLAGSDSEPLVLSGRCYAREAVPFNAFDSVVDGLSRELARQAEPVAVLSPADAWALTRIFPVLRRVPAFREVGRPEVRAREPHVIRARAFRALRELLGRLARERQVIVYIDDLQWADADSAAMLADLMDRLTAPPLLFIASVRTGAAAGALPAVLGPALEVMGDVRQIHLGALSEAEQLELVDQLLARHGSDAERARAAAREAGGHPLFIAELVQHVAAGDDGQVPRLDDALRGRMDRLDPPARRMLEVIALAGSPVTVGVARDVAGLSYDEAERVLAMLRVAHLVARSRHSEAAIETYHDRIREALVAGLDADRSRELHARLAAAHETQGGDPHALVRHLVASGQGSRAAERAIEAARSAMEALAFESAADLYRLALELGGFDDDERRALVEGLAGALASAGRCVEAARTYLEAAGTGDRIQRLDAQRRAAELYLISGHIDDGLDVMRSVLAEIGEAMQSSERAAFRSIVWNRLVLKLFGLRFRSREPAEIPQTDLIRIDVHGSVATGLAMVDAVRAHDFQVRTLRLALRAGERSRITRALGQEALAVSSQGLASSARASAILERARALVDDDDPQLGALIDGCQGMTAYFAGRFAEAARTIERAERRFRDETSGTLWELNNLVLFRHNALRHAGALRALRESVRAALRDAAARGDRFAETSNVRAANIVWLVRDEAEQARAELDCCRWTPPEEGYHVQHWYALRAELELALYTASIRDVAPRLREGFEALEKTMLLRYQTLRTETRWMQARFGLALMAAGDRDEGDARARRAARLLGKERVPYATAWAALVEAGRCRSTGDDDGALAGYRAAARLAGELELRLVEQVARLRAAALTGDAERRALVEAWATGEGVADLPALARVVAPDAPPR